MSDIDTESTVEFRKRINDTILEDTTFIEPPDADDLNFRARSLLILLSATEDRIRRGQNLQPQFTAINDALNALPEKATLAGASKKALAELINSPRWAGYREASLTLES